MRRLTVGLLVVLPASFPTMAIADELGADVATVRWPNVPADPAEPLEDQIVDHLDAIGEQIGSGLDEMSDHVLTLHVDGRHNRARLGFGHGGDGAHYLTFRIDSNWLFEHGTAHVDATVQLGVGSHQLELKLPAMVLAPDNWHGQDLVVVDVNLLERRF
ncbi:MAG TPA: hypothetical protein VH143_01555 [Kofleriaceae bacterium]|nr:hypothetical protein [Kofleriaceae bacterium]